MFIQYIEKNLNIFDFKMATISVTISNVLNKHAPQ